MSNVTIYTANQTKNCRIDAKVVRLKFQVGIVLHDAFIVYYKIFLTFGSKSRTVCCLYGVATVVETFGRSAVFQLKCTLNRTAANTC